MPVPSLCISLFLKIDPGLVLFGAPSKKWILPLDRPNQAATSRQRQVLFPEKYYTHLLVKIARWVSVGDVYSFGAVRLIRADIFKHNRLRVALNHLNDVVFGYFSSGRRTIPQKKVQLTKCRKWDDKLGDQLGEGPLMPAMRHGRVVWRMERIDFNRYGRSELQCKGKEGLHVNFHIILVASIRNGYML